MFINEKGVKKERKKRRKEKPGHQRVAYLKVGQIGTDFLHNRIGQRCRATRSSSSIPLLIPADQQQPQAGGDEDLADGAGQNDLATGRVRGGLGSQEGVGADDVADAVRHEDDGRPRHALRVAAEVGGGHLHGDDEGGDVAPDDVVREEDADLGVGPVEAPHQRRADHRGDQVEQHDDRAGVAEPGRQPRAGQDPEDLEGALGDPERRGLQGVLDHALHDQLAEVGDAAVDDLVQQREQRQEPDLRVQQRFFDLLLLDAVA